MSKMLGAKEFIKADMQRNPQEYFSANTRRRMNKLGNFWYKLEEERKINWKLDKLLEAHDGFWNLPSKLQMLVLDRLEEVNGIKAPLG